MASIPGARFDITGASGSTGLLGPKNGWRVYVLPRGGHASQDSTGTLITFDSAAVASRFAVNNWLQRGLATADIRQVSAVGGNSISISGAALTVTANDRIFLVGNTQPTVTGGSATYTVPATLIRQRDDDTSTLYTNSMITSNADGLIQFFGSPNFYDCIIQDGNRANQGSIIDLPVGNVGGTSVGEDAVFGASLTVGGALGITGWATFGSTVTMNAAMGVTGWATFGSTVTMNAALGVTGHAVFGVTATIHGALGVTGTATIGGLITGSSGISLVGGVTITGAVDASSDVRMRRLVSDAGTALTVAGFSISGWGTGNTMSSVAGTDTSGSFTITAGTGMVGLVHTVVLTYQDGAYSVAPIITCVRGDLNSPVTMFWLVFAVGTTSTQFRVSETPTASTAYTCHFHIIGRN